MHTDRAYIVELLARDDERKYTELIHHAM